MAYSSLARVRLIKARQPLPFLAASSTMQPQARRDRLRQQRISSLLRAQNERKKSDKDGAFWRLSRITNQGRGFPYSQFASVNLS